MKMKLVLKNRRIVYILYRSAGMMMKLVLKN